MPKHGKKRHALRRQPDVRAAATDAAGRGAALRRGLAAFQGGQYGEAIQAWQPARGAGAPPSLEGALAEAHFRRALAAPDPVRRTQELREAVALAPDRAVYHFHLGLAYHHQGQHGRAQAAYAAAHERAPGDARVRRHLALALLADPAAGPAARELLDQAPARDEAVARLRALAHLRANDPAAAVAVLTGRRSPSPLATLALGLAHLAAGETVAATAALATVRRSRQPLAALAREAAVPATLAAHVRAGALDAALATLRRADVPAAPAPRRAYAAACRRLAVELLLDERIEDALIACQGAHVAEPGDQATRSCLAHLREVAGTLAARRGELALAAERWQAALADQPGSVRLLRNLALAEERLERWESAATRWGELLRLWGKELAGLRRGAAAAIELRQRLLVAQRHLAGAYEAADDLPAAVRTFERVLASDPSDADLRLRVAELCLENDDWSGAIDHLRRALAARPDDVRVLVELGSAYDLKGDDRQAVGYLEKARALEPGNRAVVATLASVQHGRGHRLADAGRRDEAAAAFMAAAELAPDDPEHWECLGGAYLGLGRHDDARSAFRRARAAAPKDPTVRISIGREYLAGGDGEEAARYFREALRLDRGPLTRTAIGLTYLRRGDAAGARPYLAPALKGTMPLPLMLIGKLLIDTQQAAEAVPYLERAVALAPWEVDARINLAYARAVGQRRYDQAASELSVAEELAKGADDRAALSIIADARDALQLLWEAEQRPGGLRQVTGLPERE